MEGDQVSQRELNEPVESFDTEACIAPGVPIMRTNTARPSDSEPHEFLWLFEYGLEMDASVLNSRERLNGAALLYGPAVLKGYCISFDVVGASSGELATTILPSPDHATEVWGVLYRIPHRLVEQSGTEPSPLDKAHAVAYFEPLDVIVYEPARKREVACITYIASALARRQFYLLPPEQQSLDVAYIQQLLASARQHTFPAEYLQELLNRSAVEIQEPPEQNTEPLPAVIGENNPSTLPAQPTQAVMRSNRWLLAFALYLVLLLLVVFALAVIQGLTLFTPHLAPLGVPWFVLVYGLLGGCVSSIIALSRLQTIRPPNFVLLVWFARPYIGAVLAALAYLLLNSGLFVLSQSVNQYNALCSLVGTLAGLCEGWLFYRRT